MRRRELLLVAVSAIGCGTRTEPRIEPRHLGPPPPSQAASLALGFEHACVVRDGEVSCWGNNRNGELGDGANHPRVSQSALPGSVVSALGTGSLNGIAAVAAGYSHSLAFASDGSLLIWGSGVRGNLAQVCHLALRSPMESTS